MSTFVSGIKAQISWFFSMTADNLSSIAVIISNGTIRNGTIRNGTIYSNTANHVGNEIGFAAAANVCIGSLDGQV